MTIIELADVLTELLHGACALEPNSRVSLVDAEVRVLDRDSELPNDPGDADALPVVVDVEVRNHVNGGKVVLLRTE